MKKIIEKIKKLLALSTSHEPHEAALAMKMARELMDTYSISTSDLEVSDITTKEGIKGKYKTPPNYIVRLAKLCAELFECGVLYNTNSRSKYIRSTDTFRTVYETRPVFIGPDPHSEICGYTYDVLARKLVASRKDYRTGFRQPSNVTAARDSYAEGWVDAVERKIADMVPPKPEPTLSDETGLICLTPIEAYIKSQVDGHKTARRNSKYSEDARFDGYNDGLAVDIHRGMGTTNGQALKAG